MIRVIGVMRFGQREARLVFGAPVREAAVRRGRAGNRCNPKAVIAISRILLPRRSGSRDFRFSFLTAWSRLQQSA
jgi:hypothetical protein